MININDIIQYVKRSLGYPYVSIELSDEMIVEIIKNESLMAFESKVPDLGNRIIRKGSKKYKIKKNLYWVVDPYDREVFWVQSVVPEEAEMLANGMPYTTPITAYDNIPDLVQRMAQAHTVYRWGRSLYWAQIDGTPQLFIFSEEGISSQYYITYTRSHSPDLSTVNREYAKYIMDISLANCMMVIGHIRGKYGTFGTPVGDIPVGGNSDLVSQGETLLNKTMEELEKVKPIYHQIDIAFG